MLNRFSEGHWESEERFHIIHESNVIIFLKLFETYLILKLFLT